MGEEARIVGWGRVGSGLGIEGGKEEWIWLWSKSKWWMWSGNLLHLRATRALKGEFNA